MSTAAARVELARVRIALDALEASLALIDAGEAKAGPVGGLLARRGLLVSSVFFDALRRDKVLGATLEHGEVDGCNAILKACEGWPLSWAAYALGTAVVETNGTMHPVREAYWLSATAANAWFVKMYDITGARPDKARELGNTSPGDGAKYAGAGYVQMTGKANFARAEAALGIPLLADPGLALSPPHAAAIMRRGMEEGWFTGKTLGSYLPTRATREQFRNARRVVNGQDRADDIAGLALHFQDALGAGGWS